MHRRPSRFDLVGFTSHYVFDRDSFTKIIAGKKTIGFTGTRSKMDDWYFVMFCQLTCVGVRTLQVSCNGFFQKFSVSFSSDPGECVMEKKFALTRIFISPVYLVHGLAAWQLTKVCMYLLLRECHQCLVLSFPLFELCANKCMPPGKCGFEKTRKAID